MCSPGPAGVPQPGPHADRGGHDRGPGRRPGPRRRRLPAEALRVRRARGPGPGAVPACPASAAPRDGAQRPAAGSGPAGRKPRRPAAGAGPEGVRHAGVAAGRPGPSGLGRRTAGQGMGRDGRPVHQLGEGHHQPAAPQARRPAGDRDHRPSRLPDQGMTGPPDPVARWLPRRWFRVPRRWLRLPRRTVRLRLTLVYGGLFLLSGAALLAITYLLVSRSLPTGPALGRAAAPSVTPPGAVSSGEVFVQARAGRCSLLAGPLGTPAQVAARAQQCLSQQRALELNQLLTESGVALAIMTVVSIA